MGEAKRRSLTSEKISVLIPERGRPDELERCIQSLIDTAGEDDNYEILVAIDLDDPAWQGEREPFAHSRTRHFRWPRPLTLGLKVNMLAREAKGGVFFPFSNDYVMETPGWPEQFRAAVKSMPNGIGFPFPHDDRHPDHAAFPIVSRQTAGVLGFVWPPCYPYWFVDTHMDQLGLLMGVRWEIPVTVRHQGMTDTIDGRVDLPFWVDFFHGIAPVRMMEAHRLIEAAWPAESMERIAALQELPQRQQFATARVAHLSHPAFLDQWGAKDNTPSYPGYEAAKAEALTMLEKVKTHQPRRLRVIIAIPSARTWEARTACAVAAMVSYGAQAGLDVSICNVQSSAITHSRNTTVELCLKADCDYILWIDSDIVVPPDTLLRLLRHQKDIVGGTYNRRTPDFGSLGRLSGPRPTNEELVKGGLWPAEALPGGMMLVKADVYRKLQWPWYAECYKWIGEDNLDAFMNQMRDYFTAEPPADVLASLHGSPFGEWMKQNYSVAIDQGGADRYFSEDLLFCRKALRAGFEIFCCLDTSYQTVHLGELSVTVDRPTPEAAAAPKAGATITMPFLSGDIAKGAALDAAAD